MANPKLLVDHGHESLDLDPAPLRDLEIEGATDMQRFEVGQPSESHVVSRGFPIDRNRDLVFVVTIERPVAQRCQTLDDIDGVFGAVGFDGEKRHSEFFLLGRDRRRRRQPTSSNSLRSFRPMPSRHPHKKATTGTVESP